MNKVIYRRSVGDRLDFIEEKLIKIMGELKRLSDELERMKAYTRPIPISDTTLIELDPDPTPDPFGYQMGFED